MGPSWKLWQPPKCLICICLHFYMYRCVSGDSDITCIYPYFCWWGPSLCFCIKQLFLHCVPQGGLRGACFVSKAEPGAGELLLMVILPGSWGVWILAHASPTPFLTIELAHRTLLLGPLTTYLLTGLNSILSFLFVFPASASTHSGLLPPTNEH